MLLNSSPQYSPFTFKEHFLGWEHIAYSVFSTEVELEMENKIALQDRRKSIGVRCGEEFFVVLFSDNDSESS